MAEVLVDNLTDLWRAGAVHLPTVAIQYSTMATALHRTAQNDDAAFTRTGGGMGPLHPVWTELRNTMQDTVAVKSYDNLVAAGEALKQIAESYATTEHLSSSQLDDFHDEIEETVTSSVPDDRPPAHVPDAPSTTDPHPEDSYHGGPGY